MKKLPISVLIPTLNRPKSLENTLNNYLEAEYIPSQVIVVDQSTNKIDQINIKNMVEKYSDITEIIYVYQEFPSSTKARNMAMKYAREEIIIYSDDDVEVYKDTISILADEDLTKSEYKIILKALSYLDKVSGILIEDGVNISKNRFIEITKLSHNTFTERVNHLIDLQIMTRAKVGRANVYMINPFIFENGTYINTTLYRLFKKSKWNTQND